MLAMKQGHTILYKHDYLLALIQYAKPLGSVSVLYIQGRVVFFDQLLF